MRSMTNEDESLMQSHARPASFLEVRDIEKWFRSGQGKHGSTVYALGGVDFSLSQGRFLSIVGPSGCGKSTLLRLIDGLQRPDSGSVRIGGKDVAAPGLDRGMVFQSPNLLPWRTVVRNVEFGLESTGVHRAERRRRALEWLRLVGLDGFADFYPSQLSGGMQQRVGLVRALAIDPELLLMDEPFAAVDAQTRLVLQEELERIWQVSKKTVVFITHDVEEALFLADVVIVMGRAPSRVIKEVEVDFPHPRGTGVRGAPEFGRLKSTILEILRSEVSPVGSSKLGAAGGLNSNGKLESR